MVIRKYKVSKDSVFNKSIIIPFYEGGDYGFAIDGLDDTERKAIFDTRKVVLKGKNKEIDMKSITTDVAVVYLKDDKDINRIILHVGSGFFYGFRVDDRNANKLIYQPNYKSKNLEEIEQIFEKKIKNKISNKIEALGDFNLIKDIDYFENKYHQQVINQIDKSANMTRLIFNSISAFTYDFIHFIKQNKLTITNEYKVSSSALDENVMASNRNGRKDCVILNHDSGDIAYFIYTFKPKFINHYLLFKNLGDDKYEFITEDIYFDRLFLNKELINIKYKEGSELAAKALAVKGYKDLYFQYIEFEIDEEMDESFDEELEIYDTLSEEREEEQQVLPADLDELLKKFNYTLEDNLIYFLDYELVPLAALKDNSIKIKQNRYLNDLSFTNQISFRDLNKIERTLIDLLHKKPSSRLIAFEKKINRIIKINLDDNLEEQKRIIDETLFEYKDLWETDRQYPENYLSNIYSKFCEWANIEEEVEIEEPVEEEQKLRRGDIIVSIHAKERIEQRIGKMSDDEKLNLAIEAYEKGLTSGHFIETDQTMFMFLQYIQNKYLGKTLKLFKEMLFIFGLGVPHELVTLYPFQTSFDRYIDSRKNKKK